ncbi:MAG: response regulator [Thermoguttaceae bacterium]
MTHILVVDDSAVDRRLAGGLLEKDPDLSLRYAVNGADGLAKMQEALPDLVLTDLVMPEMDGLELVSMVRSSYPSIPVILMTSAGNEEICVQALQRGAASYVPKRVLSQRLLDTVHQVLEIASHDQTVSRLMGCMTETRCKFELDNDNKLIPPLVAHLLELAERLELWDDSDRMRIGIALEESLVNALCHGNLEVGSELRGVDDDAYYALLEERRACEPHCHRRIHVDSTFARNEARFVIRDEGPGFDPESLPDPTDPANLEKAAGRGVLLMRSFMDEVSYNSTGNAVTLVKRRSESQ